MKTALKIIKWTTICLTLISVLRFFTIWIQYSSVQSNTLSFIGPATNEFLYYGGENLLNDFLATLLSIILTTYFVIILNRKLRDYDSFSTDLLFYKPLWMNDSGLGLRRVISIVTNLVLIGALFSLLFLPFYYFLDFPGIDDEIVEISMGTQFIAFLAFWGLWGIISIIHWVKSGFRNA